MNVQEKAYQFLTYFCEGDIDRLSALLTEDFCFKGPFIECTSREEYIASLKETPTENCQIELLKSFEGQKEACLIYTLMKPGISTPMAQYFRFNDEGKIAETLLVFDTAAFAQV